ncbi:hypothetical protein ACFOOM_16200 [Streptomyces echinoruber]|uniref:Uncharacterized protein n=1 Tax=Streptomyces echinoruber TaxID=68898 RepID=A0A918R651_9ACTN|nr:hypothetical protein [Streptomyces echinoruber]GGZ86227.1 hypothetical protein GCM10010389_25790 [Streptomyces echinoruber]
MAKTGYGKRSAGDEDPHADPDFAHLNLRDREIAVFVDHLREGHAMGYKAIAAVHPRYGQQAVRVSLGRIVLAGHLRWIREHITVEDDSMRWVTRTYWSRTPRSEEWWAGFVRDREGKDVTDRYMSGLVRVETADAPEAADAPGAADALEAPEAAAEPGPAAEPEEQPGTAYETLAEVRAADPRMSLSDGDCRALVPLAAEWLSRGATRHDITRALTDGLPAVVTNPGGFARKRLESKMPPKTPRTPKKAKIRQQAAARRARVSRVLMVCGLCDADERTTRIEGGLCRECREAIEAEGPVYGYVPDTFLPGPRAADGPPPGADEVVDVTERVNALRRAAGLL